MAPVGWVLLLFLAQLLTLDTYGAHADATLTNHSDSIQCRPDQAKALLKLKQSLFFDYSTTTLPSWQGGADCCRWEGVGCSNSSGHVTVLDLGGCGLYSNGLHPVIFNLTSLRKLDLSMNDFNRYSLPAVGFERLTLLTHLNLSNSGFEGQIPVGISKLVNLISLDLSNRYDESAIFLDYSSNWLSVANFQTLVANLSYLRELYLDDVDIYSSGEDWCNALAKSVPHLQVISLERCGLSGPIHRSLSSLRSLTVIHLQDNEGISAGSFPEFFMDFVNLSVLQLADINLEGWFPRRIFQSKNLRVLDLSGNMDLSGNLPNFSNATSLETLRLDRTNFSYAKPSSSSSFKSLKELTLDGKFISMEFLSGLGFIRELRSTFSWIGDLKNLTSLELYSCDFSSTMPSSISNLKSLRSLSIIDCNLTTPVLSAIGNLRDLESLDISSCRLDGSMPSAIGNLTNLRGLDIHFYGFLGPVPSSIGNLVNLRSLNIHSSYYSGPMPSAIGNLSNLEHMDISDCEFSGPIPSTIGNLSNLEHMDISDCEFSGPIPSAIGQLKELTTLRLGGNSFAGGIPNWIGNLTRLLILDISSNYLSGEIPTSLFTLPALRYLGLALNQLSGPVQGFDVASSRLVFLDLSMNELSGHIPRSFFELTSLRSLDISSNNLVGSVNLTSFWRLTKLNYLILSNNKFSVMDGEGNNSSSSYLSELESLGLAGCNITKFPSILTRLNRVSHLDLSCNELSGDIPNWIWERWSSRLRDLNLSHNMFTGMQLNSSVLPFKALQTLDLSFNGLQGQIPMPNQSALDLDYSHNNFSMVLPNFTLYLSETVSLRMSNNSINGHIPHSVCNSNLAILDLSYNNFSGPIPSCLIENVGLNVLNLRENHFEGTLPSNVTRECAFQTIDLHGNRIEGQLPRALSNCSSLKVLDIGNNLMVDTFPSWLRGLSNLYVLILRSNRFYGSIADLVGDHQSTEREYFSSLQIIDLASNNFSGNLSSEWFGQLKSMMAKFNSTGDIVRAQNVLGPLDFYQDSTEITYKGSFVTFERILTTLMAIDFSNNMLEGSIPDSIGRLVSLRVLNMSHNAFTGKIPAQLGGMTDLESLDLSCNQLSGEIPQELTNLTFLGTLNLSDNQLVGKIPQSRQFSTFDNSSFEGNAELCGLPLSNPCGVSPYTPSESHVDKSSHVDVVLFLFIGLGFGVGFAAGILTRWGPLGKWFVKSA